MARSTHVRNYNNLNGGVITDLNPLAGAPENAVRDALNFEFSAKDGASRRKALDLESGISGNDYTQLNSALAIGVAKQQVVTFKSVLDALDTPHHDIIFNTFEDQGIVYKLGEDQQLADAVKDAAVDPVDQDTNNAAWEDITWSPELQLFVAVGAGGAGLGDSIMVSPDGVSWVNPDPFSSGATVPLNTVVWSPELEIFVSHGGSSVWVSPDGYKWDGYLTGILGLGMTDVRSIAWSPELGLFAAVMDAHSGDECYTSPDGITWTNRAIASGSWTSITWSSELGLFVAVNNSTTGNRINTSPDGITWTNRATVTDRDWQSIAWSGSLGRFVVVGDTDYVMTSTDGITWIEASESAEAIYRTDAIWSEELGMFVAFANEGTNRVMTSTDGTSWTDRSVPANTWEAGVWAPELVKFVAVAASGTLRVMESDDGISWSDAVLADAFNEQSSDWITLQGIPIGTLGTPELAILHNTDDTTYKLTISTGLGAGALIRDFTGVNDGLSVDENPSVIEFVNGSVVGTFQVEDITITDGTTTRRFRIVDLKSADTWGVDKSLITSPFTEFDSIDTSENYATWTVLGETSGATATITSWTGTGLSDAHRYNLTNQGWTQAHMDTYAVSTDNWPSNSQTWYSGRDSSNNFSPSELDKIAFGNSEAPRGHILLNPFREWRYLKVPGVWSGSILNTTYSRGFTTMAAFGSRLALSGVSISGVENGVYISPVLINKIITGDDASISDLDLSEVFKFYQRNDPTADIANELLPDDGVFIPITGANRIYKLIEIENALLVIADNGVWAITGADLQSGFLTDAFSVYKVTGATGTTNVRSIVTTSEVVYYWAADGIYAISVGDQGKFVAANITLNRIGDLYKAITPSTRESAISYYDEHNHKVYWAYNGEATVTYPEFRNKLLVLDLEINAFYPLKTPEKLTDASGHLSTYYMSINGFTQDPAYPESDGTIPLKLFVTQTDGTTWQHAVMEFNNTSSVKFDDFSQWRSDVHSDNDAGVDEDTFIETWADSLGDTTRGKQAVWCFTYMTKTETGWSDNGDGSLDPIGVSSLFMRSQWDWHNTATGNRWGNQREIYRHKRPYVPVDDTDTYDTGESIIETKNKLYGTGAAVGLRFDAQQNKDAVLLGFAIPYSIAGAP